MCTNHCYRVTLAAAAANCRTTVPCRKIAVHVHTGFTPFLSFAGQKHWLCIPPVRAPGILHSSVQAKQQQQHLMVCRGYQTCKSGPSSTWKSSIAPLAPFRCSSATAAIMPLRSVSLAASSPLLLDLTYLAVHAIVQPCSESCLCTARTAMASLGKCIYHCCWYIVQTPYVIYLQVLLLAADGDRLASRAR